MTAGHLLDTNALIDVLRAPAGSAFSIDPDQPTHVSRVTFAELRSGIAVATGPTQQQRLTGFTTARRPWPSALPVDDTVVDAHGQVAATVLAAGGTKEQLRLQVVDAHLAATAHAFDLELVTNDPGDSQDVSGLITVTPFTVTVPQEIPARRSRTRVGPRGQLASHASRPPDDLALMPIRGCRRTPVDHARGHLPGARGVRAPGPLPLRSSRVGTRRCRRGDCTPRTLQQPPPNPDNTGQTGSQETRGRR